MALSRGDVLKVVNRYIGVDGGYLGDFTYRTHAEFYPEFCDLDIDPDQYEGTTRERFIEILSSSPPARQSKILKGVLARFPLEDEPTSARLRCHADILQMIARLEGRAGVASPTPVITTAVVAEAIRDAETLLDAGRPTSAVDRVHTSLHGYLKAICDTANIPYENDASLTRLFKRIRGRHDALRSAGPRTQDIAKVLNSLSATIDALEPVRNRASMAHPNEALLDKPEAMLVINAARTILHYLDAKLSAAPDRS